MEKETMKNENQDATAEQHGWFGIPNGNVFILQSLLDGTFAPHGVLEYDIEAEEIKTFRHFEKLEDAREVFEAVRAAYEVLKAAGVVMEIRWDESQDDLSLLSNSVNELPV